MGESISKQSNQQGINLQNIQTALHSGVLSHFSHVQLFVTLWIVACQAPLSMRSLEWVAMPFSRGSSWPKDHSHVSYVSCIGRQVLYH